MMGNTKKNIRYFRRAAFVAVACLPLLGSCGFPFLASIGGAPDEKNGLDHVDPTLNLTRDDYRHMAAPKSNDKKEEPLVYKVDKSAPPIPPLAEILAAPRPPKIGETQLVSIAVTDDVPLKDVLLELAKLADVDIEVDAGITGGVEFIAKNKPFNEVIERLSQLAGLRYTMKEGVLHIERDTPYIKNYTIDFLNLDRDSNTSVSSSTSVLASSGGSGGSSTGGNGSTGTSTATSKSDFWKSLESSVQQILAYQDAPHVSSTTMQADTPLNTITPPASGAASGTGAPAGGKEVATAAAAAPSVTQQANNTGIANGISQNKTSYTINRQAGALTVNATSRQHEMIETMLNEVKANASAQVLIEAKIIEVTLNDNYQTGINWAKLISNGNDAIAENFNAVGNSFPSINSGGKPISGITGVFQASPDTTPITPATGISFSTDKGNNIISALETYGTTRTLSSPRLHAINNQQSTLTFVVNKVFFKVSITYTAPVAGTGGSPPTAATTNMTSTANTVPDGIIMTLMPSIDLQHNEVTLAVRPTLSTVLDTVNDPAVDFYAQQASLPGIHSPIPEVQVRELDSTLKLRSGQTMVIGGLMSQAANNTDTGVPFAEGIPIIGNLFKGVSKTVNNTELVILIKATIVDTHGDLNKTDKHIFDKFSDDPRPVSF